MGLLLVVALAPHVASEETLVPHSPIAIFGDGALCAPGSGVTNCAWADGSATNPYVIEGWRIEVACAWAIRVVGVSKHVAIRDNAIAAVDGACAPGGRPDGIDAASPNLKVLRNQIDGVVWGVGVYAAGGAEVRGNRITDASTGVIVSRSGGVTVANNLFASSFSGVSSRSIGTSIVANRFVGNAYDVDLQAEASGADVHRNDFTGTFQFALSSFTSSFTDARCNYWGTATGPNTDGGRTAGTGPILATPHLSEPYWYAGPDQEEFVLPPLSKVPAYAAGTCAA